MHLEHRRAPVELFVWHEPIRHSEAQKVILSFDAGDGRLLGAALPIHNPTPFSVGTRLASPAMLYNATTVASADESAMNFAPFRTLFLANFREFFLRDCMKTPDRCRSGTPPSAENGLRGLYFGVWCYRRPTIGASPATFHTVSIKG